MKFLIYWAAAAIYLNTHGGANPDLQTTHKRIYLPSITSSPGNLENSRNFSIYLGYANNPFGPSKRLLHYNKEKRGNFTPSDSQIERAPNRLKFESMDDNTVDSGHYGINTHEAGAAAAGSNSSRNKRGVIHLYNMVSCATGCNPLIYKGYGCYCGFLGSGYAVDGIDRCCKFHDWCYDTANCPMFLEYFVPYLWKCYRGRPLCAIDHGEWGGQGSCAQRLCECDRVLSECLSRFPCPSSRALCRSSPWRLLQNALML